MNDPGPGISDVPGRPLSRWMYAAILAGLAYAVVGIVFAWPDTHVRGWRLAAWVVSAAVYAAHIAYERFMLRSAPRRAALHVALGVGLGAFGLAVGALVHSRSVVSTDRHQRLLRIALVVWPLMTAIPGFVVAWGISAVLSRALRHRRWEL
jgi:hypothetical protein